MEIYPIKIKKPKQAKTGTADTPEKFTANLTENPVKIHKNIAKSSKGVICEDTELKDVSPCKTKGLPNKTVMRVLGLEPKTYGLKVSKLEKLTPLESRSYKPPGNRFTVNLTENNDTIQRDLTKIINRWPSLPPNIKAAIMTLIGGDEDE